MKTTLLILLWTAAIAAVLIGVIYLDAHSHPKEANAADCIKTHQQ